MFCRPFQSELVVWLVLASMIAASMAAEVKAGAGNQRSEVGGQTSEAGFRRREVKRQTGVEQLYHVTRWTAEDGLPQNRISALAQTPDGYLWVGTWFGLARFDGVRFVVFNSANTPEFRKESITALAVDRGDGALWIGTREGLLRLKDGQFTRPADTNGLSQWDISGLTAATGGGTWVSAGERFVFYRDRPSVVARIHFDADEYCQAEWESDDGRLALATSGRLLQVAKDGTISDWALPTGAPTNQWLAGLLSKDRAGGVWFSDGACLFRFADRQWKELQVFPKGELHVHFLADQAGGVWAACGQAGLWRYSEAGAQPIKLNERGAEKSIVCLLEDFEGHIWAGTAHGLFQLRPTLIRAVTTENGLPHNNCWSVCEAPDGAIWVETAGGAARIQNEQAQTFPDEPERVCRHSVLVDLTGTVWLGNWHDGIIAWRPGVQTNSLWRSRRSDVPSDFTLDSLYLDRAGCVWVGTDHGATWFENDQPAAGWGEFGLPTNSVRSIYQTRDGTMWFGTWKAGALRWKGSARALAGRVRRLAEHSGVGESNAGNGRTSEALFQPARAPIGAAEAAALPEVTRYATADGLADDRVFVFHEDADGALWIGTHNGLSRFKDGRFFTFRTEHGLLDNLINHLEEDDDGRLWFSCNRGIFRIDRRELNAVADGRKARANAAVYGTADGMVSPETNGEHQPAGCKARDGRLWFPTTHGVVVIDPRVMRDRENTEVSPPVIIEQVVADGAVIYGDGVDNSKFKIQN